MLAMIGREALHERKGKGISETLVSIVLSDPLAVPLGNEPVWQDRVIIGKTTSASFGYRIGKPVALAYLDLNRDQAEGLETVQVDIAGEFYTGKVIRNPPLILQGKERKPEKETLRFQAIIRIDAVVFFRSGLE